MGASKASARWEGGLKDGKGTMKPGHGAEGPFSFGTRFAGESGSNPEELIGAALSGCYSMALTAAIEKAGHQPKSVRTEAEVHLEKQASGFAITNIALKTNVMAPGLSQAQLEDLAEETRKGCPVAKALAGAEITVDANLA